MSRHEGTLGPVVRLVLDAGNVVGESLVWSAAESALYWVDIVGSRIHRLEPGTGRHDLWPTPELPTSIGLRKDGGFIVGLRQRVVLWQPDGAFQTLAIPEPDRAGNRLNEGVVAPDGSFWVGTMADNIAPDGSPQPMRGSSGALYRIAPDGAVTRLTADLFGITNTMIWTGDGRFITADTTLNTLYLYDNPAPAMLSNRRPYGSPIGRGLPDGSTSDEAGMIYNARVAGGAAIARIDADGKVADYIDVPCRSPTSCTFGGRDLDTLYVTSARFGLTEAALSANPAEGGLFSITGLGRGRHPNLFG